MVTKVNSFLSKKWIHAGQPEEILHRFPRFAQFLESSTLLSQIKVTRDPVQVIDQEPAILVEGLWVKESDFRQRFEPVYSKMVHQKLIVEKTSRKVFTYLDNGKGLQEHNPFESEAPISTLNEADYQRTLDKARAFIRPEESSLSPEERALRNQDRPFILQLVSSRFQTKDTRFHQFLIKPQHPYLRLIIGRDNPQLGTKKGQVYEAGFILKNHPLLPFSTTTGRFRSPDMFEYRSPEERVVTNIAITQEEAHRFYDFTTKYHRDGIHLGNEPGFHFTRQNCTVYARQACKAAGITIPTEIDLTEAIEKITPEILYKVGTQIRSWRHAASDWFTRAAKAIVPTTIYTCLEFIGSKMGNTIRKIRDLCIAFLLTPVRVLLGGAFGRAGAAFRLPQEPSTEIHPWLHRWQDVFDLSSYKLNLPVIVQQWQLQQPSTVRYPHRVKFAIVPE